MRCNDLGLAYPYYKETPLVEEKLGGYVGALFTARILPPGALVTCTYDRRYGVMVGDKVSLFLTSTQESPIEESRLRADPDLVFFTQGGYVINSFSKSARRFTHLGESPILAQGTFKREVLRLIKNCNYLLYLPSCTFTRTIDLPQESGTPSDP